LICAPQDFLDDVRVHLVHERRDYRAGAVPPDDEPVGDHLDPLRVHPDNRLHRRWAGLSAPQRPLRNLGPSHSPPPNRWRFRTRTMFRRVTAATNTGSWPSFNSPKACCSRDHRMNWVRTDRIETPYFSATSWEVRPALSSAATATIE